MFEWYTHAHNIVENKIWFEFDSCIVYSLSNINCASSDIAWRGSAVSQLDAPVSQLISFVRISSFVIRNFSSSSVCFWCARRRWRIFDLTFFVSALWFTGSFTCWWIMARMSEDVACFDASYYVSEMLAQLISPMPPSRTGSESNKRSSLVHWGDRRALIGTLQNRRM